MSAVYPEPRRRSVFAELVPYATLRSPWVLRELASRRIRLIAAVLPPQRAEAAALVTACRDAGVAIGLWPMLADADGRWANRWNGPAFAAYVEDLVADLDRRAALPDELLLDLEPPVELMRALASAAWRGVRRRLPGHDGAGGVAALRGCVEAVRAAGLEVSAAVVPWAVAGAGARGWQQLLGTPIDELRLDRVVAMVYTSLVEGYSGGWLDRRDAEALLARWCRQTRGAHGVGAAVAVGVVGAGALGDERPYRAAGELRRDVAIARAAGIDDIALFNLGGVLSRPPLADWLDALVEPPATGSAPRARRATIVSTGLAVAGAIAGIPARTRR